VSKAQSPSPPGSDQSARGLRERKKARTRADIQARALALFAAQGYEATTVQQIAATAEVSESTFFRYFPTKADVVLWDDFDPLIIEAFRRQPPELDAIGALRAATRDAFAQLTREQLDDQRERTKLTFTVPELRARMLDQLIVAMQMLAELVAERTGRPREDIHVRAFAGAVIGAILAASFAVIDDPGASFVAVLDDAFGALEAGLQLRARGEISGGI
jgi:AcrR family transcriptional regulator